MDAEDERKRRRELDRGLKAREIFDNPLWADSYDAILDELLSRMLLRETDDAGTLELKRQILALQTLKRKFSTELETGELAAIQLEEAKHATDRDRHWRRARSA